jgi:hypothetical protein
MDAVLAFLLLFMEEIIPSELFAFLFNNRAGYRALICIKSGKRQERREVIRQLIAEGRPNGARDASQ